MSEFVFTNSYFSLNSVVLSDHVRSSQLNGTADQQDKTAMGKTTRCYLVGLLDGSVAVELNDDLAVGSVDATIYAAWVGRVQVPFAWRADAGAISTTNPEYQGFLLVTQWNIGASVGIIGTKNVTWPTSDSLTRDTTP